MSILLWGNEGQSRGNLLIVILLSDSLDVEPTYSGSVPVCDYNFILKKKNNTLALSHDIDNTTQVVLLGR